MEENKMKEYTLVISKLDWEKTKTLTVKASSLSAAKKKVKSIYGAFYLVDYMEAF